MSVPPPQPPTGSTQPIPPQPYQAPYGWYAPPPKKDESKTVVIIVVVILLVILIPIMIVAMMFFMVGGLITGGGGNPAPAVAFGPPTSCGTDCSDVNISGVDRVAPHGLFEVSLVRGGQTFSGTVREGTVIDEPTLGFTVNFTDNTGDSLLNTDDGFRIVGIAGGAPCSLRLVWVPTQQIVVSVNLPC